MTTHVPCSLVLTITVASLLGACSTAQVGTTPEGYARAGMEAMERRDHESAERSFRSAIVAGGNDEAAALSRDALRELYGIRLFPDSVETYPASSQQAYHAAEEQFTRGDHVAATELFRSAAEQCPSNATIRVSWADTFYHRGDFAQAIAMFREAIAIDPWNRAAWRFLSDAESRLGHPYAAWEATSFAVLSDPTYEMAWIYLGRHSAGPFRRVRADKPRLTSEGANPTIHFDPNQPDSDRRMAYALAGAAHTEGTPLERERARVEDVLLASPAPPGLGAGTGFWEQMQAAKEAGYLHEAIFVNLIDAELAPEYAKYRNTHRRRLVEYIKKLVTPPPAQTSDTV